jgi:hypothetical protein
MTLKLSNGHRVSNVHSDDSTQVSTKEMSVFITDDVIIVVRMDGKRAALKFDSLVGDVDEPKIERTTVSFKDGQS